MTAGLPADCRGRLGMVPERAASDQPEWSRPPESGGRHGAVLMLFSDGPDGPDVLLTERSRSLRSHPGQVSFPGGGLDPTDDGPSAAALREAQEETGVDPAGVDILGLLPPMFLAPSGYIVTPVLAWWRATSPVGPVDLQEVASVVRAPLAELVDPANRFSLRHPSGYVGPGFRVQGLYVWGFTAGLLARVLAHAGLERPWDEHRTEELPADVLTLLS